MRKTILKDETISKIFSSPFTATLLIIVMIITGLLGSLYSSEIRKIIPFSLELFSSSYIPYIFWLLVLFTALTFFQKQLTEDKTRSDTILELNKTIRTLPPADFLFKFYQIYAQVDKAKDEMRKREIKYKKDYEVLIRLILKALLTLVEKFDKANEEIKYGLNIMIYKEISEIKDINEVIKKIKFVEDDKTLSTYSGILELKRELSVNSNSIKEDDINMDTEVEEIILPIPKKYEVEIGNKLLYKVLPGAPIAFIKAEFSKFSDTRIIMEWCEQQGDFTKEIRDQIEKYFIIDSKLIIKSFASIPLPKYGNSINGVINIHSNKIGLFDSDESLKQFICIIFPLVTDIIELLDGMEKTVDNQSCN